MDFPVIVGAGVTLEAAREIMCKSDGMIVGSWFKFDHKAQNMVNDTYVKAFMEVLADSCFRSTADGANGGGGARRGFQSLFPRWEKLLCTGKKERLRLLGIQNYIVTLPCE